MPPPAAADARVGLVPGERCAVAGDQPREKLAGDAANGPRVADVNRREAAGGHPSEVPARLDEDDRLAHPPGLDGRRDPARRAAVDGDVNRQRLGGRVAGRDAAGGEASNEQQCGAFEGAADRSAGGHGG